ncbi:MAG TPA: DedA family protein [Pyrinomonadaceae bacterium]|jgi:membrane protein DedA with SNARE-associated domain|nr:DedA family protein [Pyrinomonadaceae bacterium]
MEFLHNSLQLIEQYMLAYGYWAVFFGVMLENAGLPVPGETILLVAGYFASTGVFRVPLVMLIAASGAVVGDNIGFWIGHHFGRPFLLKIGRFFFLTPKRLEHMENYFKSHGNKTILVARFITGLRVFAALLAGASKMPWRVFVVYNIAGAVLWSITITLLGYLFGQSLPLLVKWVGHTGTILLVAAIIVGLVIWKVRKHRKET